MPIFVSGCSHRAYSPEAEFAAVERIFESGNLGEAQRRAEIARMQLRATNPEWSTRFQVEEAKVRLYQGESAKAIGLLNGLSMPEPKLAISRFITLSEAEARIGDNPSANQSIANADALCKQVATASCTAQMRSQIWIAKGNLALLREDFSEARNHFQHSLQVAQNSNNRFLEGQTLLNLGYADLLQDRYEDALERFQAAVKVASLINARQTLEKAQGNAGWAYFQIGDYQRALDSFNEAEASAIRLGSTIDQEVWSKTAGISEARLGNLDAARKRYDHALSLARSLKYGSELTQVDQSLASLLLHTSHPEQAKEYIDEAKNLAQRSESLSDIAFGQLLEAQSLIRGDQVQKAKTLLLSVERQAHQFPTTYLDAQHTLAQVSENTGNKKQAEVWYQRSITTYHEQRSQLKSEDARLPFFANGRDLYQDYVAFLIRNHRTDDALAVIDQGRAETLSEGLGLESKSASAKPRKLPLTALARQAHAVLLVYALSPQGSYLWAANSKQYGFYQLPNRAEILAQIASHRRAVLAARDIVNIQDPSAHKLYDVLVKPAEYLIHPGDRVYIIADDGMHGLNFETLLTPTAPSHYWIEDVTITNLSSLRLLAPAHHSAQPQNRLLVIGNPVYSGQQYAPLPNAAAEVTNVAAHFPAGNKTVLTGTNASPNAYLGADPSQFGYIHFVSHAVASELVPLDSAVILSPHGAPDSAKLYAREILSKPLHADLVTISACQGSGVRAYAGEGLVGLAWAFLRAGSHNVIGALWDVSDASTPELMQHLYDGIAAGQPPDVSLRAAKLQMLHSRGVFRKPIYWSAFQLYSAGS